MSETSNGHSFPADWINKLKANDDQVLRSLYAANYARVEKYVLENSGSVTDAQDLFQDAFVAMWRNVQLDKVTLTSVDKLQGYLFRIAQFKWLDRLRSLKRQQAEHLLPVEEEAFEPMEPAATDYLALVKNGFDTMGQPCKDILYRFYYKKESMQTIAAVYTWTEATAKNNKYRCLQQLRNKLIPKKP